MLLLLACCALLLLVSKFTGNARRGVESSVRAIGNWEGMDCRNPIKDGRKWSRHKARHNLKAIEPTKKWGEVKGKARKKKHTIEKENEEEMVLERQAPGRTGEKRAENEDECSYCYYSVLLLLLLRTRCGRDSEAASSHPSQWSLLAGNLCNSPVSPLPYLTP